MCISRTHVLCIWSTSLKCAKQGDSNHFLRILSMHIENPCVVHFKDPLEMFKTRGCTSIVYHQPQSCNQSLSFTQASATATGPISKPSGLQLWSSPNRLQSSLVASFFPVLGPDFKTLIVSMAPKTGVDADVPSTSSNFPLTYQIRWKQKMERENVTEIPNECTTMT